MEQTNLTEDYLIYNKPNGHAPYEKGLIHGDVYLGPILTLMYQPVVCSMRKHVTRYGRYGLAKEVTGLKAVCILEKYLWPNSYDMVNELLPKGIIEFTAFSHPWGTLDNHNTVIWEIR